MTKKMFRCRHSRALQRVFTTVLCACVATACARPEGNGLGTDAGWTPLVTFDTARAVVTTATDTFMLSIEIAEHDDQRAWGLMERPNLPEDAGMIFLYDSEQPASAGFWMYRTRIPLDIAYLDEEGTILRIVSMDPCPSADPDNCRSYPPGVRYHSALEVNRGWFARRGVAAGDRVMVDRSGSTAL